MKETYENLQCLLQKICLEEHRFNICADLKSVALLTGLQADTLNYAAFSVNGTAERGTATTE